MSRPSKRADRKGDVRKPSPKNQRDLGSTRRTRFIAILTRALRWIIAVFVLLGALAYGTYLLAASGAFHAEALHSFFGPWLGLFILVFVVLCHGAIIARSVGFISGEASTLLHWLESGCNAIAGWFERWSLLR
jgi:hypothetical protein